MENVEKNKYPFSLLTICGHFDETVFATLHRRYRKVKPEIFSGECAINRSAISSPADTVPSTAATKGHAVVYSGEPIDQAVGSYVEFDELARIFASVPFWGKFVEEIICGSERFKIELRPGRPQEDTKGVIPEEILREIISLYAGKYPRCKGLWINSRTVDGQEVGKVANLVIAGRACVKAGVSFSAKILDLNLQNEGGMIYLSTSSILGCG